MLKTPENIFQILQNPDRHYGDNLAIVDGDIELTYRQVYQRIGPLANFLSASGIRKGDRLSMVDVNSHFFMKFTSPLRHWESF